MDSAVREWDERRKLWFVINGLDDIPPIAGLSELLPKLQSRGITAVLGFDSEDSLQRVYGDETRFILRACGNSLDLNARRLKLASRERALGVSVPE